MNWPGRRERGPYENCRGNLVGVVGVNATRPVCQ